MMNNFTPRAQQILVLSRREADRFNHNYVGTEHLLLGLIRLGQGTAFNVLQKMGINLEAVRRDVEKQVGAGPQTKMAGSIPYTPRVKKVLALAGKEAKALSHSYVGTEHILLGLLREGEGVAGRLLKNLEVDLERTRLEVLKELDPNFEPSRLVSRIKTEFPYTARVQKMLKIAREEAQSLNSSSLDSEHILLGLLRENDGIAASVLKNLGLDFERAREEILKNLTSESAASRRSRIGLLHRLLRWWSSRKG